MEASFVFRSCQRTLGRPFERRPSVPTATARHIISLKGSRQTYAITAPRERVHTLLQPTTLHLRPSPCRRQNFRPPPRAALLQPSYWHSSTLALLPCRPPPSARPQVRYYHGHAAEKVGYSETLAESIHETGQHYVQVVTALRDHCILTTVTGAVYCCSRQTYFVPNT